LAVTGEPNNCPVIAKQLAGRENFRDFARISFYRNGFPAEARWCGGLWGD
jgi:hypothetical protein